MAQVIAKVGKLSGEAFARDASGNVRRLKAGDVIREGETVVASDGAQVQLKMADGRELIVRSGESAKIDAEVAAEVKPDAADSSVANNQKGFQKIAKALTGEGDLDALLEDPAVGAAGAGGGEGHSFIEFLRVVETVDPLAFQFGTGRGRVLDTIEGGAARVVVPPEIPPETENVVASGSEDAPVLVSLKGSDADGFVTGYVISSLPENGTLYSDAAMTQLVAVGETVAGPVFFKPSPNWNGVTTFLYASVDDDGKIDTTPATATINVLPVNDPVGLSVPDTNGGLTVGDVSVPENGTLSGQSFTLSAPDGLDPTAALTIAGTPVSKADLENSGTTNINITTPQGVMTITGYNPVSGVVTYSYDPSGSAKDHTGGNVLDTISIIVKDDDGDTQSGNLVINITDTAPLANPDTNAITEDALSNTVGGNVVTTGAGTDTLGADTATVTGVATGNVPAGVSGNVDSDVTGTYGKVTIAADGTYTYTLDNSSPLVQALNAGQQVTDIFTYTLTDADGNASTTTLTITVTGANDGVTLMVPDTNGGLTVGDVSVPENGTLSGQSFTISAPDGLDPTAALTIAGTPVSKADLENSGSTNINITTPQGVMTITGYNPVSGVVTYSYDPSGSAKDHTGGNVLDTISIIVKDDDGDTQSGNLVINITDTAPLANPDTNAITEDALSNTVGGNVVTTGAGTDTLGADTATVTGVATGNVPAGVSGNVGSDVTGTYGKVTIAADGTYTYTLDNSSPLVQALNAGQQVTDIFTYTLTDADGDVSTTTLTITVTGANDAPDITVGTGDSAGASLTEGNSGLTANGTLSIFDVDTLDTVSSSVTGVTANYSGPGVMPLTNAQLLGMFSVLGGESSTTAQSAPNGIGWTFNSGSQAFNFLPAGQTLTLTYNVRATDSSGASNNTDNQPVTITITGTNDGVVANADTRTIAENAATAADRSGNVLTNDILDPDLGQTTSVSSFSLDHDGNGSPTTFLPGTSVPITSASGGTLGVFTMASNGIYSFTPQSSNYSGPVPVINYTASSTSGDSASSTLTINVTPVSDAPGVTRDAANVTTNEDTAVALGFNAPTVTDAIDQTGPAVGDNPELLGLISLSGIPRGAILQDALGNNLFTIPAAGSTTVTVRLSDATNLIANPGVATLTMTTAQFESLRLMPPAHSGADITQVRMTVTEYEVDASRNPLDLNVDGNFTNDGASRSADVRVNVLAVTDPIDLRIAKGNGPHSVTISEDSSLNLTSLLSATFQDLDGSERRDIIIANPAGNGTIFVNGVAVLAGASTTIAWNANGNNLETSQTGFPAISITTGANFSGDLNGITVTLRAQDTDPNGGVTPAILTDTVTLNLFVTPIAGDVTIANVSTPEDAGVRFLNALSLSDTDGSESITGITVNNVPAGWVIRDDTGAVVLTGTGSAAYSVPAGEVSNGDFRNYTVTPPAHSSADATTLSMMVQTTDTRIVNGSSMTSIVSKGLTQRVTVSAVAEIIGSDSNADGTPDLTMNPSFAYTTAGQEDQWFTLNREGFNLETPWSNQDSDGSEKTFALLTPSMNGNPAIGSQFKYTDGSGTHVLTFTGSALQIPMSALDTLEFKAPANVAGTFSIGVQALTVDTDPNGGASVQAISGSATLSNLVIEPVADPLTLAVNAPAVGLEDTAIALVIRPYSADPSETFTVSVNGIPAGAKIHYGGVELTVTGGSVSIANFSKTTSLTITPPPNSNVDIPLSVSAVSVDTVGGVTSTSGPATLPLLVDVRGVADPVTLTVQSPLATTEAAVDGGNQRIPLSSVITAVTPADADGSESVALVISGVPVGYTLEGLTFMGGVGAARIWSGSAAEVAGAKLVVLDANFSGKINFNVRAVSTENDGNSLSGAIVPVTIEVAPSPEATLPAQTTALEDALTQINFAIQHQNGDGNETLSSVWISVADLAGKPFALFIGNTPISTALVADGGWYKLSAADAANVFVKGSANNDADASFAIKYEIRDPSNDGSLPATVTQFDATHTVTVTAVTDATVSTNNYAGGVIAGTTTIDINVTVTQQNDVNAGNTPDIDGSERLLYFIIDNVPVGVTVEGGRYIGNTQGNPNTGRWILDTPDVAFNSASLNQSVRFSLDGTSTQLSSLNQQINITAHTQDTGAAERTSTTNWTLQTVPGFVDSSPAPINPAADINLWTPDAIPAAMVEDMPTALSGLVDAQITGNSPYAITLTGLPAGTVVTGMLLTVVGGQNVWTAQGSGDNASLQTLLGNISITPPANWNANQGPFGFSSTLTTYDNAGTRHDASLSITPAVTPVSDPIVLTASDADVSEDAAASITLSLSNLADGTSSQVVNGKVYISLNESGMEAGGTLSFNGVPLTATAVTGVAGMPNGNYYVLNGVGNNATLGLSYQPAANASGTVAYTAYVQGQESGAANVTTSAVTGSFAVNPLNDGVSISAPPAAGFEDQPIPLAISATLNDAGEVISSVTLTNVPDGFLVFTGAGSPGSMATNLGGGVWGIPLVGGAIPSYVGILPPKNWSGTVGNIQVGVWSGEPGLDPVLTTTIQSITANGVADGITITPTLSFGLERQIIELNLNSAMPDHDGSELATLTIQGLGAYAAFYAGASLLNATYASGTDTYTIAGLTPAQVGDLGVIQKDGNYNLTVTAQTIDSPGSDSSAIVTANMALEISPAAATAGNDRLLYDGGPLNGLAGVDTIEFRLGENIDFSASPVKPTNIEQFDLMPAGQNHSLGHLSVQDVLDMTGSGKSLTILGDSGDSVSLKSTLGGTWSTSGAQTVDGHNFDVYVNSQDAAIKVLIEQSINKNIDP